MASFLKRLDELRRGDITVEAVVEDVIFDVLVGAAEPDQLLDVLHQQQSDRPLPIDVFTTLKRQIQVAKTSPRTLEASKWRTTRKYEETIYDRDATEPESESARDEQGSVLHVGDVLKGRFKIEEVIARGGMSIVYRVLDKSAQEARASDPYLALKVMNVAEHRREIAFMALHREAHRCKEMGFHPNIVHVYDFDRDGNTIFLTMEY